MCSAMMATLDIRRENYKLLKANSFLSLTLLIPAIKFHNHYNILKNCFCTCTARIYIPLYIRIYIPLYIRVCIPLYIRVCIPLYIRICIPLYIRVCIPLYIRVSECYFCGYCWEKYLLLV